MEPNWTALRERYKQATTEDLVQLYKSGDLTDRVPLMLIDELRSRDVAVPSTAECEEYRGKREKEQETSNRGRSRMWELAIFLLIASGLGLTGILSGGERRAWLVEAFHYVFQPDRYYLNQGVDFLSHGYYQAALNSFLEAERRSPNNYILHTSLGTTYAALGQREKAIPHFQRAIALKPDPGSDPEAYQSLSLCFLFLGDNEKATEYLNRAVLLYDSTGKPDQAIQARRQLQKLQSGKR
jgi:tetratricopeptide (TPR) repeat protein